MTHYDLKIWDRIWKTSFSEPFLPLSFQDNNTVKIAPVEPQKKERKANARLLMGRETGILPLGVQFIAA